MRCDLAPTRHLLPFLGHLRKDLMNRSTTVDAGRPAVTSWVDSIPVSLLDLEELRTRCMRNESLVEQILRRLPGTLESECNLIRAAHQATRGEQLRSVAHRLKGTAANVGSERLRKAAERLCEAINSGPSSACDAEVQNCLAEARELIQLIDDLAPATKEDSETLR